MTQEQKDRALACIRGAERIGEGLIFAGDNPCCSLGWLLYCAGVTADRYYRERVDNGNAMMTTRHPELTEFYGLDNEMRIIDLTTANDTASAVDRREALLALIESWEVEDASP